MYLGWSLLLLLILVSLVTLYDTRLGRLKEKDYTLVPTHALSSEGEAEAETEIGSGREDEEKQGTVVVGGRVELI